MSDERLARRPRPVLERKPRPVLERKPRIVLEREPRIVLEPWRRAIYPVVRGRTALSGDAPGAETAAGDGQ